MTKDDTISIMQDALNRFDDFFERDRGYNLDQIKVIADSFIEDMNRDFAKARLGKGRI